MKTLLLLSIFVLSGYTAIAQSQASASFTASVTIIEPIGITTTSNMNFANVDAKTGGTIILTPDNTRITSGGVELEEATGVSAATFEITGEQGSSFSLSIPNSEYILSNGNENIIIKDFTSSLAGSGNIESGSKVVRVGATLDVNPNQAPGTYTSTGPLNVTVNYN